MQRHRFQFMKFYLFEKDNDLQNLSDPNAHSGFFDIDGTKCILAL